MQNPFRVGEHVRGEHFCNREQEVKRLAQALRTPTTLLVYGRRRMGKSSAIHVASAKTGSGRKPVVVFADVSSATTVFDVATRLLRSLYLETRSLRIRLEELVGGLSPQVTVTFDANSGTPSISFGLERRRASEEERRRALEAVFERLAAISGRLDRPVAVVLDEFQAIHSFGGEPAEWHLRDLMQRHGGLSYICAGSQESLIQEMIGPGRAFYKMFEMLHLGPIAPVRFAGWIDERLRTGLEVEGDAGAEVVREAGPRTQDIVQVARQLYFRAAAGDGVARSSEVSAAIREVMRNEEPLIRTLWNGLSAQQQDVLRVVSLDVQQMYASDVRDRYGLPGPSSVRKAIEALIRAGLLVRDEDAVRFDSPFFRAWVREAVAPDLG
jgi:hypothetical protein